MSELEIRSGGAVAVDCAQLRSTAARLRSLGVRAQELAARARVVGAQAAALSASGVGGVVGGVVGGMTGVDVEARMLSAGAERIAEIPFVLAKTLEVLAAAYELIEVRAERAVHEAAGHAAAVAALDARDAAIIAEHPEAAGAADDALRGWRWAGALTMAGQVMQAGGWNPGMSLPLAGGTALFWRALAASGAGRMDRHPERPAIADAARPSGSARQERGTRSPVMGASTRVADAPPAPPRPVQVVATTTPAGAGVSGLADAAARVPGKSESRIRVERYAMPGGAAQFAVYIAGTQSWSGGTGDPFDMRSNLELYRGDDSASLDSVELALRQSGVGPHDPVHVFGHSQGGMLASALALGDDFDVRTVVTFGSPVAAPVAEDVLSVGIRHLDDPVAALAGAGHAQPVGAAGSFIAERVADPRGGVHDVALHAHGIEQYARTAELVDSSDDPRARALQELWRRLGTAERVEAVEYSAQRGG